MPSATTVSPMLRRLLSGVSSALLLGSLLAACAPSQMLSVAPMGSDSGRVSSLISHPDSVYVRFHFVRAEARELVFEAEFSNAASHPVTVDPARFYYQVQPDSTLALAPDSAARYLVRHLARDPETRLDSLASRRDELADKASRVSTLEIIALLANVAADLASINRRETPGQAANRFANQAARYQSTQAVFAVQRVVRANKAQQLNTTVSELAVSSLRRATLQPGDRAVGLVYFPRLDAARQLRFVLAFDEQPVSFDFTQEIRKPNGKPVSP